MSDTTPMDYAEQFLRSNVEEWCWTGEDPAVAADGTRFHVTVRAGRGAAILDVAMEGRFVAVALARGTTRKSAVWFKRRFDSKKDGWDRRFRNWTWPTLISLVSDRTVRAR